MQFILELVSPYYFNLNPTTFYPPNKYQNDVLEKMYGFIIDIYRRNNDVILINYADGIEKNMLLIVKKLGMTSIFIKKQEIFERMKFHSKAPTKKFK